MQEQENEAVISINWGLVATKTFQLSICVGLAVAAPYFLNQLITGSIVNALLFISASTLGLESAFLLCLIPSLISIYTGLLPIALAPMIPFIMTGNALLVLVFFKLGKRNFWMGATSAALVKFIFIWSVGMISAGSVLHGIASKVMLMTSWPQLVTAIAGACIAFLFLKTIKKY
jgi:hypothetical protein